MLNSTQNAILSFKFKVRGAELALKVSKTINMYITFHLTFVKIRREINALNIEPKWCYRRRPVRYDLVQEQI